MKIKLNVPTIALFAALNFTLVDLSDFTFVYAPQTFDVSVSNPDEVVEVDVDEQTATGNFTVVIYDQYNLAKEVEVHFDTSVDMQYAYATSEDEEGYSFCGIYDCEIVAKSTHLVNGDKRHATKYELSPYQIEEIKQYTSAVIGSISTVDGIILDDVH